MKKVLVIHYSQSGQLNKVVENFTRPMVEDESIQVVFECLKPKVDYPFPWPIFKFFSIFPETVHMVPPQMEPMSNTALNEDFDLIILAYQVWFLSPSLPVTGFLRSEAAKKIMNEKPVMTLIGCRNMWLMAQEKVKLELKRLGAKLIDNVVLTDRCNTAASFLSTPLWMFTGKKKAWKWVPKAGISEAEIKESDRFGKALVTALANNKEQSGQPLLKNLGAVKVVDKYIASEKIGSRSFYIWGKLLRNLGDQDSLSRRIGLIIYIVFLVVMILTVVPINAIFKKLLAPFFSKRMQQQVAYFAQPSGE